VKKIDLYQLHKSEYVAPKKPVLIECQPAQYLAVKGKGEPAARRFSGDPKLYKDAFTIKMASKFAGRDYAVCKLEGIWRAKDDWTLMIRTPDFITKADVSADTPRRRVARCSCCTWVRTTDPRVGRAHAGIRGRVRSCDSRARIMRFICPIRAASSPRDCAPFCGNR
jgi:hypothetical protein